MRAALLSKGVRPQMVWTGSFLERNHIASDPSQTPPILKESQSGVREAAVGLQMTVRSVTFSSEINCRYQAISLIDHTERERGLRHSRSQFPQKLSSLLLEENNYGSA